MKKRVVLLCILFSAPVFAGSSVRLRFVNEVGEPLANTSVMGDFETLGYRSGVGESKTDADGRAVFENEKVYAFLGFGMAPSGSYSVQDVVCSLEPVEREIVVPRKLNPIPLYAVDWRVGHSGYAKIPRVDEWCGFDFEVADWVAPDGKGRVADLKFKLKREFMGYYGGRTEAEARTVAKNGRFRGNPWSEDEFEAVFAKWRLSWDVAAVNPHEGIVRTSRYFKEAQLKLPHHAPESGYGALLHYAPGREGWPDEIQDSGFFVRSRVKLDEKGQIVSANYAKIHGDFVMLADKTVHFCYYYNPTPNDRNLEFDTKRNLMPKSKAGQYTQYGP